ncbi:COX15/CtaA family protein [Actinopolymorpha cephalotaxi]|uniref:Cytochrome c oxidase assembly protein subunit 15 n=1 Tax=Actinopolymorpha cephalotaxi TaxID=504797 RepID=A0ABX2RYM5_9ACTN|nr:COX15/CtaA family protein [Actinopolymorpha cephalotaxi]NYH82462.1 cytochrome c oxidase assembly protein subunit 15 [Actinopolymorpha cephalotaxi]
MQVPRPSLGQIRGLAVASVVANLAIVVTGGAVRLTGSGLGCPTWPRCTETSFVSHPELGLHGAIEFGNRLLTFALAIVVGLTWLAAMRYLPRRRDLRWLSGILLLGIPAQAVMGGITVLTHLNPWVVGAHFMVSPALVAVAVVLARRTREPGGPMVATVPRPVRGLAYGLFATAVAVLYLGTVVTGSGPHAGDLKARRNGLDPAAVSQVHADVVFLLIGLTVGMLAAVWATGAPARARRAALALLLVEVGQGAVGFVQYFTGLPAALVGVHVGGAALTLAVATWVLVGTREPAATADEPAGTRDAAETSARRSRVGPTVRSRALTVRGITPAGRRA